MVPVTPSADPLTLALLGTSLALSATTVPVPLLALAGAAVLLLF